MESVTKEEILRRFCELASNVYTHLGKDWSWKSACFCGSRGEQFEFSREVMHWIDNAIEHAIEDEKARKDILVDQSRVVIRIPAEAKNLRIQYNVVIRDLLDHCPVDTLEAIAYQVADIATRRNNQETMTAELYQMIQGITK